MSMAERGKLIGCITAKLRFMADSQKKTFDAGDLFFQLAFKSDAELHNIARLANI